ncbi:MAG: AmmeMemoRadiSam system radical SAM enzyme [Myxococcales bacterium]|nr:AmmeMemoRadiSam system radical SAM enzyme [Myxococcales bacterium]
MTPAPTSPVRLGWARLLLAGACTAAFQTLLGRELLAAFSGNEAVLAALLGPWLLLTAAGAWLGRTGAREGPLSLALLLYGPLALATLFAARVLPRLFPAGSPPGVAFAFLAAAALAAPCCLLSGACFSWLSARAQPTAGAPGEGAARAYLLESVGSAAAGAALSLVVLGNAPPAGIAAGILLCSTFAAVLGFSRKAAAPALAVAAAVAAALCVMPLDEWTVSLQAPHLEVRERRDSAYASIVVSGPAGQATVLVDRMPVATHSDQSAAEESAHLPLAFHPSPRAVAIIGVAPVGTAREVLRHGVERIDYVLEDGALLSTIERAFGDLSDSRLSLRAADPRRWLFSRPAAYDAILLVSSEPTSAQLNRLFTAELYEAARDALNPGGLLAVSMPGHAAYAGEHSRRLHSSVRATLASVMGGVHILPADRTFYLTAKGRKLTGGAEQVSAALAARRIAPAHLGEAALAHLFSPRRMADASRWASLDEAINRDLHPTTFRLALDRLLAEFGDLGVTSLALVAAALAAGALLVLGPRRRPIHLAVMTSGASGLSAQLALMLAYQIAAGALYRELGLLLAGFMVGAAAGSALAARWTASRRAVLVLDAAQIGLLLALWATLPAIAGAQPGAARALCFTATVLAGLLPGAQFAVAARALAHRPGIAGSLYATDLVGAAVAALLMLTVAVPALGLSGAVLALAAIKALSAAALLLPAAEECAAPPRQLAPLLPLAFAAFVLAAAADRTQVPLYAFTFLVPYQVLALLLFFWAAAAAFEPMLLRRATVQLARRLSGVREWTGANLGTLAHYALLLPVAAFPLARCYFRVPYLFCHVCPRPCVFGVLRPYAVTAGLLANLHGQRFCERLCPLGTLQGACERLAGRRARRIAGLWVPRLAVLLFVAVAYFAARQDRGEGVEGGPFFSFFFKNAFSPSLWVLASAAALLLFSLFVRRPFCEALCPIGAASQALGKLERRVGPDLERRPPPAPAEERESSALAGSRGEVATLAPQKTDRRLFLRRSAAGCGVLILGAQGVEEFGLRSAEPGLGVGFRNDAPGTLDRFSRPASWSIEKGHLLQCVLCPHACILGENDRGFCRTRVVKGGKLHSVAYGNLCSAAMDPMEKKPLYHFMPRSPILSVAIGGCNLRCLNCQNWEISQARPHEVASIEAMPEDLVRLATESKAPAIAYTYSEPLVSYEYVRDAAELAREKGIKNVLVTAGYINERPLRELCRHIDAVTLDVKAFRESFYREVSGGRLKPVLRALEVFREEGVWIEVSFLMVPSLSDEPGEIAEFARWVAEALGPSTPFHILRFHPAHRLEHLPWTPIPKMEKARQRAVDEGLQFVYLGNVPGHEGNHTRCPKDGRLLIERKGYHVTRFELSDGRCPCGEPIAGVFET